MSNKINKKATDRAVKLVDNSARLAGGFGMNAAKQDAFALLRRATLASLLWENLAYESGQANAENVAALIPQVEPGDVADLAVECRKLQKLRHMPLFLAREMARYPEHNKYLGSVLPQIITRADQLTDFVALYFKDKKQPLTNQVKKGLAEAFQNFDEYQFAKYNRDGEVKLRDVLFLSHAKPTSDEQEELFRKIVDNELKTPDTWEVALSGGADKKETFSRLISSGKLGGLAFLRNLRNIREAKVDYDVVKKGFDRLKGTTLLPLNFYAAQKNNPEYTREIEDAMLSAYKNMPKLAGHTVYVVDVSGSMGQRVSNKSEYSRMEVAAALAMLAAESSERVSVYVTAGSDGQRKHKTEKVGNYRGFGLCKEILDSQHRMGGGGIFTRQCLEYLKEKESGNKVDRIIIFSDSADCDEHFARYSGAKMAALPKPFGKNNYIVDVSAEKHGVNYKGVWTAEVSGWSENFLTFIAALEGLSNQFVESNN